MPGGSRILRSWEPVLFYLPRTGRNRSRGLMTRDVLTAPVRQQGFLGSKPPEWTRWVLAALGYDPGLDDLDDLFPGSGAVTAAADGLPPSPRPASSGTMPSCQAGGTFTGKSSVPEPADTERRTTPLPLVAHGVASGSNGSGSDLNPTGEPLYPKRSRSTALNRL